MGGIVSMDNPFSDDKENKGRNERAAAERSRLEREEIDKRMAGYINTPGASFDLYGDNAQAANVQANLSQVGAMSGQNIFDAGRQQQDYYQSLQSRRNGTDSVAADMEAGRNRNVANVGRQFAGRGIAGGVAAAGMNTANNTADKGINAQKQTNARQNDSDLWNYVKRNQKVTGEALAMGQDQGLAGGMDTSQAEGALGSVICSELYRQGLMSHDLYLKDMAFGMKLEIKDPNAIYGYRLLATPVVRLMRKSKIFTRLVSIPALAWAKHMAGEKNSFGKLIMTIGLPICRTTYKVFDFAFSTEADNAL